MKCPIHSCPATVFLLFVGCVRFAAAAAPQSAADALPGQPVDIAPSAYLYRSDRAADQNPPESWFALMRYANLPLNEPVDIKLPAIKQALLGLLWEEIRPIRTVQLIWADAAARRPAPGDLVVTTLNNRGTASSWWNNLIAVKQAVTPKVSGNGLTLVYDLDVDTCGIVVSVAGTRSASEFDVPTVRVLTTETWKTMDVEIEWAFDPATAGKDYSGRIEAYDGVVTGLRPFNGDTNTTAVDSKSWRAFHERSPPDRRSASRSRFEWGQALRVIDPRSERLIVRERVRPTLEAAQGRLARRGVRLSLLYMGTSKWRRVQPFTTQREDVARTIVTLWTRAGNVSFLAADLENGPILAPEYGFFIRRTSQLTPALSLSVGRAALATKMDSIAGSAELRGWGSDATPWFGANPSDKPVVVQGINIPAGRVAMHPGPDSDVAVGWCSPMAGRVKIECRLAHAQSGGDGIEWRVVHASQTDRRTLTSGATDGTGLRTIPATADAGSLSEVRVVPGNTVALVVGRKGNHFCDTTTIELVLTEVGGLGRVWNLAGDVTKTLHAANPHADGLGNAAIWGFFAENLPAPSEPPFALASTATSAAEFIKELKARKLSTIRQQIQVRNEQTWEGAVTAMRGGNPPPHPKAPTGLEPPMQVRVPCERLTAQWNLGLWHLVRHCDKNPKSGRLWFNDYPYGILGAETYLILNVLDQMGAHAAADGGFDQWTSLPMNPNSAGHHEWALPDRPNGLFSDGHGCLTHAVGPNGVGGHMDGVHAFGPGSIGWALVEHYWMTGDTKWLEAHAPRIKANAEWMLRQRQVLSQAVPGGERLWCKGLQPALQVTPDSGGLWMQFYEAEAYYWAFIARLAAALGVIDPAGGAKLAAEAEAYRQDLRAAVERSIALSPVVPVRDGTFRSVIPFACYVRGLGTAAWGWQRDGSGAHVGPLYWDTVQSAAALVSPAALLSAKDARVQGYLDVLEDRLLLENSYVGNRNWFEAGWQYQGGLERTANMHLAGDDIPVFLRSFLNCYAVDILPNDGFVFNEHAVHGPPDKIFEEAAFLERFRNLLVMEDGNSLWLARAAPRAWFEPGLRISVQNAPSRFGIVGYEIVSDTDNGRIAATVAMPSRNPPESVRLRFRHPKASPMRGVVVNGAAWPAFDPVDEVVLLRGLEGVVKVECGYGERR
jgi:hypothetical protein